MLVTAGPGTTIAEFGQPLWDEDCHCPTRGISTHKRSPGPSPQRPTDRADTSEFLSCPRGRPILDGTGTVVEVSRDQNADLLPAVQTSIGVLGILTEVTIKVAPTYQLHARTDIMNLTR